MKMFDNKIVIVTGGTGSFGNAFVKHMLKTNIGEIRVFSRDEKKQYDMRIKLNSDKVKFYLGDVRDFNSINDAMKGANYVFHAAALKQVPTCEFYPMQAVQTNIIGVDNVVRAAILNKLEKVVVLSTDKAVYPVNAMGISKAMMEKIIVSKSRLLTSKETILCATRYGNVMGTRGSVIPLFIKQILENKPITITNPSMTRFLMSLDDSVDLVLYALKHANQGDIFVQKASSCTIKNLALALKDLFNSNVEIKYIGTRHGEKLYETLVSCEEMAKAKDLGQYYQIAIDDRDLNYTVYFDEGKVDIDNVKDYTSHNIKHLNLEEIKELLLKCRVVKYAMQNKKDIFYD